MLRNVRSKWLFNSNTHRRASYTVSSKVSLEVVIRRNKPVKTARSFAIPTKTYIIPNNSAKPLQRAGPPPTYPPPPKEKRKRSAASAAAALI